MISPWMQNGNIISFLQRETLSIRERVIMLQDVAAGLTYLHSQGIIHGDLTGANILIDDTRRARLIDFGLSSIKAMFEGTSYWSSTVGGAIRWRAPELLPPWPLGESTSVEFVPDFTVACDIFSFGNVMLHAISDRRPYFNLRYETSVLMSICHGTRPKRPLVPLLTDSHWDFINWCWGDTPSARPCAAEVLSAISDVS
ncbi:kinase-like protein [Athelia psychrophila]|uniref:Kinase-like protein n=1 Tax=Athelia psychrophila TaxID=1759441 RepID=A0A166K840_9AGAM|nr:kinase-like protein [Fibularhizoctonia sp. CBS 109695]